MAQLNAVFLMGCLTRDPEMRRTPDGTGVTDLGLALNRKWKDKSGEMREEVTFIDVTVFGKTAEACCEHLRKGSSVHVEGFLKTESWNDKATGEKRSKVKVQADRVQFLAGKPEPAPHGERPPAPSSDNRRGRPRNQPATGHGKPY